MLDISFGFELLVSNIGLEALQNRAKVLRFSVSEVSKAHSR